MGWEAAVSGAVTLGAVALGGWLTSRVQFRQSRLEYQREWRSIRLERYNAFVAAYREYVAFALEPSAKISAVPHPRLEGDMMPFFDEAGRPYRENLETTKTAVFLVCGSQEVRVAAGRLVRQARNLVAARHSATATELPAALFEQLWSLEREFINVARADLGLPCLPDQPYGRQQQPPDD